MLFRSRLFMIFLEGMNGTEYEKLMEQDGEGRVTMPLVTWQKMLDVLTLKGHDTQGVKEVKQAKDDDTRLKICYSLNKSYLLEWMEECLLESSNQKSASESALLRARGNNFYKHGNDIKSLEIYNQSIIVAPHGSEEMALALANRSAVLSRLHHFEEALTDIDLALESGYPEDKKSKLFLRKANLLIDSKRCTEAIELLEKMEEMNKENSDTKIKEDIFATRCTAAYMLSKELEHAKMISQDLPKLVNGENHNFKCASNKLELKISADKGRYVVANVSVDKGDVLFVEKPFALIVLPDQTSKHCHHCCKLFIASIPCVECNDALYCSNKCRSESWQCYHKWECGGLPLCYNIGIAHLGLRVALISQTTQDTERYQQVYNLLPHIENMTCDDLYQYTLTAALLTIYLKDRKKYFPESDNESNIYAMGGRILRHIAQMICNGHAITKIDFTDDTIKSDKIIGESKQRIATAIYPSASMMNHSCNNNISNCFENDILIVRASKNIKMGGEVFNCYGPHYKHMEVQERQQVLKNQYFFTCKCDKCVSFNGDCLKPYSALKCINCDGPVFKETFNCASCNKRQPVVELMNMSLKAYSIAAQGRAHSNNGEFEEAVKCFDKSLELGQKCLFRDNFDLLHYKDQLAKNYAALGNYKKSVAYLEDCLNTIEGRYGGDSSELIHEYFKLMDIRFLQLGNLSDSSSPEYRKILKKTMQLLKNIQTIVEINSSVLSHSQRTLFEEFKLIVDFNNKSIIA